MFLQLNSQWSSQQFSLYRSAHKSLEYVVSDSQWNPPPHKLLYKYCFSSTRQNAFYILPLILDAFESTHFAVNTLNMSEEKHQMCCLRYEHFFWTDVHLDYLDVMSFVTATMKMYLDLLTAESQMLRKQLYILVDLTNSRTTKLSVETETKYNFCKHGGKKLWTVSIKMYTLYTQIMTDPVLGLFFLSFSTFQFDFVL